MSSSSRKIFIKSSDRVSGSTSEGVVNTHTRLRGNYTVESFCVTNNIYNITSSNNMFYFIEDGNNFDLVLTSGAYSNPDLACEIATQLDTSTAINKYCVEYNANTGKYEISILTGILPFNLRLSETTNTVAKVIGFLEEINTSSDVNPTISDSVANINVNCNIFMSILDGINSNKSILTHRDGDDPTDRWETIMHLFNNFKFGDVLTYRDNHIGNYHLPLVVQKSTPNEFHLSYRFHDNFNNDLSLNDAEWELILQRSNMR